MSCPLRARLDIILADFHESQEGRMSDFAWLLSLLLSVTISTVASSDDRQKAEKQVRKITAMATDKIGRRMVSMSIADTLKIPRPDLVEERCKIGLDYGSFFIAHELVAIGVKMTDIVSALSSGDRKSTRLNSSHSSISYA